MDTSAWYRLAADAMLILHLSIVLFALLGLLLTFLGGWRRWRWVRSVSFRAAHLLLILVIVGQSWLGIVCPLTTWEMQLRRAGGQQTYDETFVAHWLGQLLFFTAPPWVFITAYSAFGTLVLLSFWVVPMRWGKKR